MKRYQDRDSADDWLTYLLDTLALTMYMTKMAAVVVPSASELNNIVW